MVAARAVEPPSVLPMSAIEARVLVKRIQDHATEIGRLLLDIKDRQGWRSLGYSCWTEFLNAEFEYSRKHLYELMAAATVTDWLQLHGKTANHSQAYALSRFPPAVQPLILEVAEKRPGGATEDRIRAIGTVLQEMHDSGYVTTPAGHQSVIEAAIQAERVEIAQRKRYYVLRDYTALATVDPDGLHLNVDVALDVNSAKQLAEGKQTLHLNVWIDNASELQKPGNML